MTVILMTIILEFDNGHFGTQSAKVYAPKILK